MQADGGDPNPETVFAVFNTGAGWGCICPTPRRAGSCFWTPRARFAAFRQGLGPDPECLRNPCCCSGRHDRQGRKTMTQITHRPDAPIAGRSPGPRGLRKKTPVFMGRHYLENFVQAIFDVVGGQRARPSSWAATGAISTTARRR
jgi:hypothetical protein